MDGPTTARQIMEILKVIAPWLSGGFAGAVLTLIVSARRAKKTRQKTRRILSFDIKVSRFSLPQVTASQKLSSKNLRIAYKGTEYEHLLHYEVALKNIGFPGIDEQSIVLLLPPHTRVIEDTVSTRPLHVVVQKKVADVESGTEYRFAFERIEKGDSIVLSFLLDCPDPDAIKALPRGVDDAEYRFGETANQPDIEQSCSSILYLLVLFILGGGFPFVGGLVQSLVFFMMIPYILRLLSEFMALRRTRDAGTYPENSLVSRHIDRLDYVARDASAIRNMVAGHHPSAGSEEETGSN
jgi:hypothetical protein